MTVPAYAPADPREDVRSPRATTLRVPPGLRLADLRLQSTADGTALMVDARPLVALLRFNQMPTTHWHLDRHGALVRMLIALYQSDRRTEVPIDPRVEQDLGLLLDGTRDAVVCIGCAPVGLRIELGLREEQDGHHDGSSRATNVPTPEAT